MGKLIALLSVLLLAGCGNSGHPGNAGSVSFSHSSFRIPFELPQAKKVTDPTIAFHDPLEIKRDSGQLPLALKIRKDQLRFRPWSMPFHFSTDSVLLHFYPGHLFRDGCDWSGSRGVFTCWKCNTPPMRKREYLEEEHYVAFPAGDGNESRWLDTLLWQQPDGQRYLLVSFSTSERSMEGCTGMMGRFSLGWLGLALFRAENERWQLIAFDPAVEATGQFSNADAPSVRVLNRSSFVILVNDHDQGGGSPTWEMAALYTAGNGTFTAVFPMTDWGAGNRETQWSTTIRAADSLSRAAFPDLLLQSEGELYKMNVDEIGESCNVPEAAPYLAKNEALHFSRTQHLHYANGKYRVVSTTFVADSTWTPGK